MSIIKFKEIGAISQDAFLTLMNHPAVQKHMPLSSNAQLSEADYSAFLSDKRQIKQQHGYGPHAIYVDSQFAGWAGLQPYGSDVEMAVVLHPNFWGYGLRIFHRLRTTAFDKLALNSVIALLPPSRRNLGILHRLGFAADGEVRINNQRFLRFRLKKTC